MFRKRYLNPSCYSVCGYGLSLLYTAHDADRTQAAQRASSRDPKFSNNGPI